MNYCSSILDSNFLCWRNHFGEQNKKAELKLNLAAMPWDFFFKTMNHWVIFIIKKNPEACIYLKFFHV